MTTLHCCDLRQSYGDQIVLNGLNWSLSAGQTGVLLGQSGCGKTTLLRAIAGLIPLDAGEIKIAGADVTGLPPHRRDVAMGFQNDPLYDHQTVGRMLTDAAKRGRYDSPKQAASQMAEQWDIGATWDRTPDAISGGQRQRVSVVKAILRRASVCLFDEPLSSIDAERRETQLRWLREVAETASPDRVWVHVTHDGHEAMRIADIIAVMRLGQIIQTGTPSEIYQHPTTRGVAAAIGTPAANWVPRSSLNEAQIRIANQSASIPAWDGLLVRPHHIQVNFGDKPSETQQNEYAWTATVCERRWIDRGILIEAESPSLGQRWRIVTPETAASVQCGDAVALQVAARHALPLIDDTLG